MDIISKLKSIPTYNKHFLIAAILILVSFFTFYPSFYTTTDEKDYIENSYLIGQGRLVKQDSQCSEGAANCGYSNGNGYISKYNLGLSFLLVPFVAIDWRITFLISILIFILGMFIFKKLLERRNIRAEFIYLYSFFPIFVYYSRKVMTEVYALTFILIIFYLLFEKSEGRSVFRNWIYKYRFVLVGILSGVTVLIKYTNIIFILPMLIYWLFIHLKPKVIGNAEGSIFLGTENKKGALIRSSKDLLKVFLGSLSLLITFFVINYLFYGSPIRSGYYFSKEELLIIPSLIIPQGIKYILILIVIYPGLAFGGVLSKYKHRFLILVTLLISFVFFVGFPGYSFNSGILDFIFGIRFLIPILGLVLLIYFEALNRAVDFIKSKIIINKIIINIGFAIIVIVLIANMFAMTYIFNGRVKELFSLSSQIYSSVPEGGNYNSKDIEDRKLINEAFKQGKRWLFVE